MKIKLVKSIMAPLVVACALVNWWLLKRRPWSARAAEDLKGHRNADNSNRLRRSRDKEFPSLIEFVAGGTVVESNAGHRGSEDAWRRCLAPYH